MKRRTAKRMVTFRRVRIVDGRVTLRMGLLPRRLERLRKFYDDMHDRDPEGPYWDPPPRITWRCRNKASAGRKGR